MTTKLR